MAPKVIMFCDDCTLYGVPVPQNTDTCGNCGSHNVTVFYPSAQPARALDGACGLCGSFKSSKSGLCLRGCVEETPRQ